MILHQTPAFTIYFGNKEDQYVPGSHHIPEETWHRIKTNTGTNKAVFAQQIHGIQGHLATHDTESFSLEGDYLLTQTPGIGIGVLTADCLSIVFYDPVHHAAAITHAGWRGTAAHIAQKTLTHMNDLFATDPETAQVFFGPGAQACCYAVGPDFYMNFEQNQAPEILTRNSKHYFNQALYNHSVLERIGVHSHNISYTYHHCTICNTQFSSHRRENQEAHRQITLIVLH